MEPNDDEMASKPIQYGSKLKPIGPYNSEPEKKEMFWMGGVFECFSSVLSLLGREDLSLVKEDDWEVPFEAITDMVYLGSGAQGVVYSGHYRGEMVAVKKLRDKSETDIKHLRKLNHENIVRFRGVCTGNPCYGVIMEYCQYGPLFDFLHSGACYAPKQILKWAKEIAHGMTYLHNHKIIHRDLKSPNILIADNLTVKVSDFGTSREWNDVSTIMSFTGTVAWMAPEVIRHEPCSEKVDVWSYAVVLWELLTQEVPYKNLETHAIMWGVGTDTISLPIPTTCPESLQQLLKQCWTRSARYRPTFKIITGHLEIAGTELIKLQTSFRSTQASWRKEVQKSMDQYNARTEQPANEAANRREELKRAQNVRQVYEKQLSRTNDLFMEVCSVRLQLENREKAIFERERALKACRCSFRKNFKHQRQLTSSSDAFSRFSDRRRKRNKDEINQAQLMVKYLENKKKHAKTVTMTVDDDTSCDCSDESENNNIDTVKEIASIIEIKETVVEKNGNIDLMEKKLKYAMDNFMQNAAHV